MGCTSCKQSAKTLCGVLLVLIVDAIWVGASYIVQLIYKLESSTSGANTSNYSNTTGQDKATPYLLTTVANSLFIIYLPLAVISHFSATSKHEYLVQEDDDTTGGTGAQSSTDDENANLLRASGGTVESTCEKKLLPRTECKPSSNQSYCNCIFAGSSRLTKNIVCRNAKWAFITCWFWFGANFCYNWSLQHTSVSSNTIISSSSGLFTFLLSFLFVGETFTYFKLMGVVCTALGFLCIAFDAKDDGSNEVLGDIVCLIAAFVYGCYTTLIKAAMPDEENSYTALFFGFLGLFNSVIFGSLFLLVWQMHWEVYDATTVTGVIIGLMVTKALIDNVLSDFLWAKAITLLSPTVVTIGLSLQIPMTIVSDSILGQAYPDSLGLTGAAFMVMGFVGVALPRDPACISGTKMDKKEDKWDAQRSRSSCVSWCRWCARASGVKLADIRCSVCGRVCRGRRITACVDSVVGKINDDD